MIGRQTNNYYIMSETKGKYSIVYKNAYFGPNKCLVPVNCGNKDYYKTMEKRCEKCVAMACVDQDLKNRDLFKGEEVSSRAITLHFSGCNLNCKFCWAYPVRYSSFERKVEEVIEDIKCMCEEIRNSRNLGKKEIKVLILSGNEPLIQISHIVCLLDTIKNNLPIAPNFSKDFKVLIRTNGTLVSSKEKELMDLKKIGLNIKFQVSLKGVNKKQFEILSGSKPEYFEKQISGYKKLIEIFGKDNVYLTLGIYHNTDEFKLRYAGKKYNFKVEIIFPDGTKMDFNDFDEEIMKDENLRKELENSSLHKQYFEWFPTVKSKTKHNPDLSEIIQITCPKGRKFRCDFIELRKKCEKIANNQICDEDCRDLIAALHGKDLKAVREFKSREKNNN